MNTFERDKERGEGFEYHLLNEIKKKYPNAYKIKGYENRADLIIPELKIGIECKLDLMCEKTGNLAIEYEHTGKPSGIWVTKSKYWAIAFNRGGWKYMVIPVEELQFHCSLAKRVEGAESSKLYLIPVNELNYKVYKIV